MEPIKNQYYFYRVYSKLAIVFIAYSDPKVT